VPGETKQQKDGGGKRGKFFILNYRSSHNNNEIMREDESGAKGKQGKQADESTS